MEKLSVYLFLDTRRKNANNEYPIQLRVYSSVSREQKRFSVGIKMTKNDFYTIWDKSKPNEKQQEVFIKLKAIEANALKIASQLYIQTVEAFQEAFFNKKMYNNNADSYYENAIENFKRFGQLGTASNYTSSLNSLKQFYGKDHLPFHIITPTWLRRYEQYMIEVKCRSVTTVGIYLRPLRAIFNTAIEDKTIAQEIYPFSKRKYMIPAPKAVKKALSREQLKLLFESEPLTPDQIKAKDFWFFSYMCNGMNIKDIALLRHKSMSSKTSLQFRRAKTSNTNKTNIPVSVILNSFALEVIEKYGIEDRKPNDFIFPILADGDSAEMIRNKIKNFTRYINQHFLKFAQSLGIEEKISTYWARHSFATRVINSGASTELLGEMLSHSDIKTTQNYIAGFDSSFKKEIASKLMEF